MKKFSEKYSDERKAITEKIINILELEANNFEFTLYELENNKEKQEKLLDLKTEIQKFFEVSSISTFKPEYKCKRPYLNLARSILRKQGYTITISDFLMKVNNGLYKRTKKYKISLNS